MPYSSSSSTPSSGGGPSSLSTVSITYPNSDLSSACAGSSASSSLSRTGETIQIDSSEIPLLCDPSSSPPRLPEENEDDFKSAQYYRTMFLKYDQEGFAEIPWDIFVCLLKSPRTEFHHLPYGKRLLLLQAANQFGPKSSSITLEFFVNLMTGKRSRSFKCAMHHRELNWMASCPSGETNSNWIHESNESLLSDCHHVFIPSQDKLDGSGGQPKSREVRRLARLIADEYLTDERDRKYYADNYSCTPPPWFIVSMTCVQLGVFVYYGLISSDSSPDNNQSLTSVQSMNGPIPTESLFVYRPDKRTDIWRWISYSCVHAGWLHLLFNVLVQLLVGLPLEMVHGSMRIMLIYMAGVLAGSLGTSVFDPNVYLVGASGGVYALLAAHLANVLINYNNMEFGVLRLIAVILIASVDVGYAIYDRYSLEAASSLIPTTDEITSTSVPASVPVSYVAHLTGALAGLTIGLLVLKNFEQRLREQCLWWIALGVYATCMLFAIIFNLMRSNEDTSEGNEFVHIHGVTFSQSSQLV